MSLHIPSDIANIILEYYSQMRDMKWVPFIDVKNGKLKWKVNKHSAKYDNMNKLLKHREVYPCQDISIRATNVGSETINDYNTIGTIICLKKPYLVNQYQMLYPICTIYVEFIDNYGFKNSFFCSIKLVSLFSLCKKEYDVYQDGHIRSMLYDFQYENNTYSLIIAKY
jgi:hypothetical protein